MLVTVSPASSSSIVSGAVSRRDFVRAATLAAGCSAWDSARAAEARRIPVGFLGTGYSHFAEKHRLLRQSAEFEVVGLCEEDAEVRARGPAEGPWLTPAELFRQAHVVVVESAVRHHARDARRALEAGCHVHVEKPPAATLVDFQDLLRLAEQRKRRLQIGYMWRYNPGLNGVIEAARSGWLGEVFLVRAVINTWGDEVRRREWAEFPGGILFELGCHLLDPIVRLMGPPRRVESVLGRTRPGPNELVDHTTVLLEFDRAVAILNCAAVQPGAGARRGFEVQGTNGVARVQPLEPPKVELDLTQAAGPYPAGRSELPVPPYQRYGDEFKALAAAIRQGTPLPVTPAEEERIQAVLMQACRM
jgi:predicted dehydrogenase